MSSDFRQSANNANNNANNKEGANPSSSFQSKTKKAKSSSAAKKEENKNLIEKNFREGYTDYSKDKEPISRAVQEIVREGNFSSEAINRKVNQIKDEEINKLRSRYPGTFKDEDFSSNNIEKPSSGMIDTETQRTFRNLINETAKKSVISAKAIEELAGLEYFSEHIKGLEEKAKMGEIVERKVEEGLEDEDKDNAAKVQKKNKFEKSKPSIKNQEEKRAEKPEKDKSKEIKSEKKSEKSELTRSQTTTDTEKKMELDSDDEEDGFDESGAEPAKEAEKTAEHFKSVANFDGKVEKIKKDKEASEEKQKAEKETVEMPIKEHIKEIENKDGSDELEEKIESYIRDENIKEFRKKMAADTKESRKSYEEVMKEIEGFAKEEGFEGLDIDGSGRSHISTNRYGFTKDSDDSSNWIKAEYDTPENKRVVMGEENLKNFNEWMQTDSKESKESIQDILKHEAQHPKGPAKKSSNKESKEIKKRLEEEEIKIVKGEPAKTPSQITKEEHDKFYGGRDTQGIGYEMQTELQRINEDYKNIDDFIDTQARMKLGIDISNKGLGYISKNPYAPENADDILPIEHYNFIKPELIKKVVSRLEEMREDLADKYEIKKNKDNLKIFGEVLKNPASGGLDLAERMQDNANAKIDFLAKKIDLRNELRKLVKDEAEKTGKSKEEALDYISENKEYQKLRRLDKLNQINLNIADSKFKDDPEKIEFYEEEKKKIIAEEKKLLLENERNLREYIGNTIAGLNNINNSEESASGKESGIKGLSSYFELAVKAYGNDLENNEELKKIVEDARELLKENISHFENKEKKEERILSALKPISTVIPNITPSVPYSSSPASTPQVPASISVSPSMPSPQAPQPSQGGGNQGGGMSVKSGVSSSASKTTSAPSAPAQTTPSVPATSPVQTTPSAPIPQASQTTPETTPADAPLAQPQKNSAAPASPQTPTEPASASMPAPSTQHQSPARTSQPKGEEEPAKDHQTKEIPTEPVPQEPTASQNIGESAQQSLPEQNPNISPNLAEQAPAIPASQQATDKPAPPSNSGKIPSQSQGMKESVDNTPKENGGEMTKEKIEKIKDAVREKLEDSLEKNIDNGMGGVMIQGKGEKSDADKISEIKGEAEEKAGQGLKKSRFASLNNKMNAMNENMHRKVQEMQRIKNESLVPVKERQKEIEEKIQKQKSKIANKFNARKRAMLEKARKLKKAAGIKAKKSHISPGMVKILTAVTLVLAVLVDIIDVIGAIGIETIVFTIIAYLINFVCSIIITATWMIIFSGHKGKGNKQSKVIIRSILILFGLENIPIIELLPFNAIAVILNYLDYREGNKPDKS